MGHGGRVHHQSSGNRRVRLAFVGFAPDEASQVQGRQAVSLLVLCHLRVGVCRCIAYDHRHFSEAGPPGSAQALGAEVDLVAALRIGGMDDDGLQDAALTDVVGEFAEIGVGEFGAWITRVFVDAIQGHDEWAPAGGCRSACR